MLKILSNVSSVQVLELQHLNFFLHLQLIHTLMSYIYSPSIVTFSVIVWSRLC
jgi:hypothetical protein